jgi:hypothetical protein
LASADPQTLLRLLEFFAQRSLIPARVKASTTSEDMCVLIEIERLSQPYGQIIAEKMRQTVLVISVGLSVNA